MWEFSQLMWDHNIVNLEMLIIFKLNKGEKKNSQFPQSSYFHNIVYVTINQRVENRIVIVHESLQ